MKKDYSFKCLQIHLLFFLKKKSSKDFMTVQKIYYFKIQEISNMPNMSILQIRFIYIQEIHINIINQSMEKGQFFSQNYSKYEQKLLNSSKDRNKNYQFLDSLKCKSGNKADHICYSKSCEQNALMCIQQSCKCNEQHNSCIRLLLKDFVKKIQAKTVDISPVIQQSTKIIDNFIDKVIDQASKLKQIFQNVSQLKYQYYFLEQQEKNILLKLKKNDVKDLKGQKIYQITNFLFQNKKKMSFSAEQQIQNLQKTWKSLQIKLVDELNKISQKLNKDEFFVTLIDDLMKKSSIVKTTQESKIINQFFDKRIQDFQLLYKASENQFMLKNYYEKCTEIPNTLILIQTQHGKKVGGFTSIQWKKSKSFVQIIDKSKTSFIFSLTEKQKLLPIIKQNTSIKYDSNTGPIFGNSSSRDISINQKSNQKKSDITFNYGFQSNKFNQKNDTNLKLYNGSSQDSFLLKQWQIWKVTFAQ